MIVLFVAIQLIFSSALFFVGVQKLWILPLLVVVLYCAWLYLKPQGIRLDGLQACMRFFSYKNIVNLDSRRLLFVSSLIFYIGVILMIGGVSQTFLLSLHSIFGYSSLCISVAALVLYWYTKKRKDI